MLSEIPYGTLANYSPRGSSKLSQQSRGLCGHIKAGKITTIKSGLPHLRSADGAVLAPFMSQQVTLVPVPRSAPVTAGGLWPSMVIAETLRANGFGREVLPCIERATAVQKSSSSPANERPLVPEHYDSLRVNSDLVQPEQITLVDDVLTMGRTMFACALRIHEAFPQAKIRAFAMIRTQGFIPDVENIVDPSVGTIRGYPSGKTHREP